MIPSRGAWLEFEVDKKDVVYVRIDRKRKQPVTILLKALGFGESEEELLALITDEHGRPYESMRNTLDKDNTATVDEAFIDIYRKLRPGEPPTPDSARALLENLFFNPKRYDQAKVGRHKVSKKLSKEYPILGLERFDLEIPDANVEGRSGDFTLTKADILATVSYLVKLHNRDAGYFPDDIDHFGNRRVRTVGELIQNQLRVGLIAHGARRARAHDDAGRRGDHAADAHQHPAGGRGDQGVLRLVAAVAVHGPDEPARGAHAQAPPLGARPRWSVA